MCCPHCVHSPPDSESLESFAPTSTVESLLDTNLPPHHSSLPALLASCQAADSYVQTVKSQIKHLEDTIATLTEKVDQAASYVTKYKKILHPIRSLPNEVLAEIFFLCTSDLTNPLCVNEMPWVLGQVCRRWRDVALSAPKIYSNIALKLDTPRSENPNPRGSVTGTGGPINIATAASAAQAMFGFTTSTGQFSPAVVTPPETPFNSLTSKQTAGSVSLLSTYLSRSREYPLTICIFSDYTNHPLLSLLYLQSNRWRKAFLSLSIDGFKFLSSSIRGSVGELEILNLYARIQPGETRASWNPTYVNPIDGFEFTPKLHCLYAKCIPNVSLSFKLPFQQIKRFHSVVDGPEAVWKSKNVELLNILSKMTSLRECQLDCAHSADLPANLSQIVHQPLPFQTSASAANANTRNTIIRNTILLPTLQTLVLTYTGPQKQISHLTQIFNALTLPALKDLHIFPKMRQIDTDALVTLAERSGLGFGHEAGSWSGFAALFGGDVYDDDVEQGQGGLKKLHLHRTPIDEVKLLRAFPGLEGLGMKVTESLLKGMVTSSGGAEISDSALTNTLGALSFSSTGTPFVAAGSGGNLGVGIADTLLPNLRTMKVYGQPSIEVQGLLVDVLESRCLPWAEVLGLRQDDEDEGVDAQDSEADEDEDNEGVEEDSHEEGEAMSTDIDMNGEEDGDEDASGDASGYDTSMAMASTTFEIAGPSTFSTQSRSPTTQRGRKSSSSHENASSSSTNHNRKHNRNYNPAQAPASTSTFTYSKPHIPAIDLVSLSPHFTWTDDCARERFEELVMKDVSSPFIPSPIDPTLAAAVNSFSNPNQTPLTTIVNGGVGAANVPATVTAANTITPALAPKKKGSERKYWLIGGRGPGCLDVNAVPIAG
ncbi:hypothetical protein D9758_013164 [Tetrapyrgos nigripes]|uniref:F-box domain-containing protein n=1 Tax=Tetrapyrgos nigripes TaxID=182062 RepID=A0A8H5CFF3_9AGAR|nr:hypothetical protein D9758_013164 [Tetrapyrgos nigripes]